MLAWFGGMSNKTLLLVGWSSLLVSMGAGYGYAYYKIDGFPKNLQQGGGATLTQKTEKAWQSTSPIFQLHPFALPPTPIILLNLLSIHLSHTNLDIREIQTVKWLFFSKKRLQSPRPPQHLTEPFLLLMFWSKVAFVTRNVFCFIYISLSSSRSSQIFSEGIITGGFFQNTRISNLHILLGAVICTGLCSFDLTNNIHSVNNLAKNNMTALMFYFKRDKQTIAWVSLDFSFFWWEGGWREGWMHLHQAIVSELWW